MIRCRCFCLAATLERTALCGGSNLKKDSKQQFWVRYHVNAGAKLRKREREKERWNSPFFYPRLKEERERESEGRMKRERERDEAPPRPSLAALVTK